MVTRKQRMARVESNAPSDDVRKLIKDLREAELLLTRLSNEAGGSLGIAEAEIRQAIGNTNVHCLQTRIHEAREFLDDKCTALEAAEHERTRGELYGQDCAGDADSDPITGQEYGGLC